MNSDSPPFWRRIAPALTLMVLAPLVAEVLPGATRLSAIFVLPIEIVVWGGGALMIRAAARRRRLGWSGLLCLALSLAVAEECLIQQTSLAPMVLQIKGGAYARALGVNYVYLLWALFYESVLVVFVPVYLTELIYPARRAETWLSRAGLAVVGPLFVVGAFLAWFSWTQIARPKVFHVPAFNPPLLAVVIAVVIIGGLFVLAFGPARGGGGTPALRTPPPWLPGVLGAVAAILWYGLVLLAFGIAPEFPPAIPIGVGLALVGATLLVLPRWAAGAGWGDRHTYALIGGTTVGAMLAGFIGFRGAAPADLWFKVIVDAIAAVLLWRLAVRIGRSEVRGQTPDVGSQ